MRVWDLLRHFSREEPWGDPDRVSGTLLLTLEAVRERLGWPIVVHAAYATAGHNPRGYHPRGLAVDFHFATELPLRHQVKHLLAALDDLQLAAHVGLGLYPDWTHPGFHLDVRGYRARWGRLGNRYVPWEKALAELERRVK